MVAEKHKHFQNFLKTFSKLFQRKTCSLQYGALGPSEEPERLGRVVCCQQAPPQIGQPRYCRYAHTLTAAPPPPPLLPLFQRSGMTQ